jgi:hypothetical protein
VRLEETKKEHNIIHWNTGHRVVILREARIYLKTLAFLCVSINFYSHEHPLYKFIIINTNNYLDEEGIKLEFLALYSPE